MTPEQVNNDVNPCLLDDDEKEISCRYKFNFIITKPFSLNRICPQNYIHINFKDSTHCHSIMQLLICLCCYMSIATHKLDIKFTDILAL